MNDFLRQLSQHLVNFFDSEIMGSLGSWQKVRHWLRVGDGAQSKGSPIGLFNDTRGRGSKMADFGMTSFLPRPLPSQF